MKQGKRRWLRTPFSIEYNIGYASMKSDKIMKIKTYNFL